MLSEDKWCGWCGEKDLEQLSYGPYVLEYDMDYPCNYLCEYCYLYTSIHYGMMKKETNNG